jgi:hypothetical protein
MPHPRHTDPHHNDEGRNAMMPWIISHDLMRAKEEETVRATRYAHHRAHTYRRPGPILASLLQAWLSKVPVPRHVNTALIDPTPMPRDPLCLAVFDLGSDDIGGAPDTPVPPSLIA